VAQSKKYDKVFYKKIKELNAAKKHDERVVIQVSENEAILIYWGDSWTYDIYPFEKQIWGEHL
jgi:hypothetical protein